ncbi:MAG: SLBB domain-containing protein [Spirochaetes bacterium]|nr:SLBB domain-containing protein [Spirochaetota bacterium]
MNVYSFPQGGLDLSDPTAPPRETSVLAFLPLFSVIPLSSHSGGRVYSLVSAGDVVKEGMLVGRASGSGAVNVHATVPGRVVRKALWKDIEGLNNEALVIRMEGAFEKLGKKEERFQWAGMNSHDIQRVISDYGIVEMENRGRPLADKISNLRREADKLTLVVRCVFDDPWLAADYVLCKERLKEMVEGCFITARACKNVEKVLFAVSRREKELGEELLAEAAAAGEMDCSLVLVGNRYPQRNKRELELSLRMYEKKENLDMGSFIIFGPATMAAVYDAVKLRKPILDRYVAVGGSAVKNPSVIKARVGTRIAELVEQCGGFTGKPSRIIVGSPIAGREIVSMDEPVDKTCYAVYAMTEAPDGYKRENCMNCGECRQVCPVGLDPEDMYKRIVNAKAGEPLFFDCHGCGCCKVVCPSALPLSDLVGEEKLGVPHD